VKHSVASTERGGSRRSRRRRSKLYIWLAICTACVLVGGVVFTVIGLSSNAGSHYTGPVRYLGVYEPDAPGSYVGIDQFAKAIGRQPNLVSYYSPWLEPFQVRFASSAAKHGAVTLVQLDPTSVSLANVAEGRYDPYLRSYAIAVKKFGTQVILSFCHEMNGAWYSWGYTHTSPAVFVAAWRHVVNVFRSEGARNVTWLWTVNIISSTNNIPSPAPWWPGRSYVTWVGIDGYYYGPSWRFDSTFGPTIAAVRDLTAAPVLVAETGASTSAGQPAKITDLFSGVQAYGLRGFVWFDEDYGGRDWRIGSPAAFSQFRQDVRKFMRPASQLPAAIQPPSSVNSPAA
jgi:hypothetical protein